MGKISRPMKDETKAWVMLAKRASFRDRHAVD
jgi:hypothetical protein